MELISFIISLMLGFFLLGMCLSAIAFIIQLIIYVVCLFLQLPDWIKGVIAIIVFILIVY